MSPGTETMMCFAWLGLRLIRLVWGSLRTSLDTDCLGWLTFGCSFMTGILFSSTVVGWARANTGPEESLCQLTSLSRYRRVFWQGRDETKKENNPSCRQMSGPDGVILHGE